MSIGLPATPIYYHVDRIRNGRSYSTRAVRAIQSGKTFFIMLCSYQKPEPWQPTYRSPMPKVPTPEECDTFQVYLRKRAGEQTDDWTKGHYIERAEVCILFHPIEYFKRSDFIESSTKESQSKFASQRTASRMDIMYCVCGCG